MYCENYMHYVHEKIAEIWKKPNWHMEKKSSHENRKQEIWTVNSFLDCPHEAFFDMPAEQGNSPFKRSTLCNLQCSLTSFSSSKVQMNGLAFAMSQLNSRIAAAWGMVDILKVSAIRLDKNEIVQGVKSLPNYFV